MNKKKAQSEETKARIIEAANNVFSQRGYHAASIEDIANATGVSKANIYYHFKSKEGLFLTLLDQYEAEWKALWAEQLKRYASTTELLNGMIDVGLKRGFHHPLTRAAREFLEEAWGKSVEGCRQIAIKINENRAFYQSLIQQGIDSGEFKSVNTSDLGRILEAMFRGLGESSRDLSLEEAIRLYRVALDALLYGIVARD
ncbi:TetR/AcrR family transcriptional regulator [Paenibacillus paeoniae]|uniref:TetR/AcrR family transcriptional regulator n=1 Tax=Paenibacillus paeoniae TaxID=2292705 RepID=A0A371P0Z3_9BACL|nr:TetR/AcrR family transcriptional regulator [Paenibacillus paeoniae]REK69541.1 TetR/AcrR family transcriptional regulator [Paenibacillus paeoniae]